MSCGHVRSAASRAPRPPPPPVGASPPIGGLGFRNSGAVGGAHERHHDRQFGVQRLGRRGRRLQEGGSAASWSAGKRRQLGGRFGGHSHGLKLPASRTDGQTLDARLMVWCPDADAVHKSASRAVCARLLPGVDPLRAEVSLAGSQVFWKVVVFMFGFSGSKALALASLLMLVFAELREAAQAPVGLGTHRQLRAPWRQHDHQHRPFRDQRRPGPASGHRRSPDFHREP